MLLQQQQCNNSNALVISVCSTAKLLLCPATRHLLALTGLDTLNVRAQVQGASGLVEQSSWASSQHTCVIVHLLMLILASARHVAMRDQGQTLGERPQLIPSDDKHPQV
jgi:hypothetical protein